MENLQSWELPRILTPAEEKMYFARLTGADRTDLQPIIDHIVEHNLRLVRAEATKWPVAVQADAFQYGTIGLITAVGRFNPQRGCKFSTYAVHWIRQGIRRGMLGETIIRLPTYISEELGKLNKQAAQIGKNLDELSAEEIAQILSCTPGRVVRCQDGAASRQVISLDGPAGPVNDDRPYGDLITAPSLVKDDTNDDYRWLHLALDQLCDDDRIIIELHFLEGRPLDDIARKLQMTRHQVAIVKSRALRELRYRISCQPYDRAG